MPRPLFLINGLVVMQIKGDGDIFSNGKASSIRNSSNIIGKIEPGKWICQLGLHLNTPASCSYITEGFDKVVFLTLNRTKYEETIGKIYKRELTYAMQFI